MLTTSVAKADEDLVELVSTSNSALGAIAEQDPSVRRGVELLGPTLQQAEETLTEVSSLAQVMGPTFNDLRPFARNLDEANVSLASLAESTTPVLRDEIRPFVRAAREPIPDLRRAADKFSEATPRLTVVAKKLNKLGNMAGFNPRGQESLGDPNRDEGYLFWLGWLGHNSNLIFNTADGNGPFRRIYFTAGCDQLRNMITGGPDSAIIPNPPGDTMSEEFRAFIQQQVRGIYTGLGPLFEAGGVCDTT